MTLRLGAAFAAAVLLSGCASTGGNPRDPLESVNRAVFKFNDTLDANVLKPIARGYTFVLPQIVRDGVTNFFGNISDLWIGANNLLQGKVYEAASDLMRVSINTVLGLGGLLDVASSAQLEKHDEDFGQTLGRWGVPSGPYVVLPFLGPSTARDAPALAVDYAANPLPPLVKWGFQPHHVGVRLSLYGLHIVNTRANLLTAGDLLDVAAVDRYSFVRDAYLQRRRNQVYDGAPPPEKEEDDSGSARRELDAALRWQTFGPEPPAPTGDAATAQTEGTATALAGDAPGAQTEPALAAQTAFAPAAQTEPEPSAPTGDTATAPTGDTATAQTAPAPAAQTLQREIPFSLVPEAMTAAHTDRSSP